MALPVVALVIFFGRGFKNWGFDLVTLAWTACMASVASLLIWYAYRGYSDHERQMILAGWKWGIIIGVIGFLGGFIIVPVVGSWLTAKDAPQAPLLGIFITGPASFPIGVVIGIFVKVWQYKKLNYTNP